jgi:hypothetical protein
VTTLITTYLLARIASLRRYLRNRPDGGYTVEAVAVIALLVVLALGVVAVISAKVLAKANSINLNG